MRCLTILLIACFSTWIGTSTSVAQPYETDAHTIVLYHLNDGSGGSAQDASGNALHATVLGATWTAEGAFGGGIVLDGDDDLVVPETELLVSAQDLTFEAWVYRTADAPGVIIDARGFGIPLYDGPYLGIDASGKAYVGMNMSHVGIYTVTGTSTIPLNTWTHLIGIFEGSPATMRLLVNRAKEGESVSPGTIAANRALIGRGFADLGPYFIGRVDEVRISNIARTLPPIAVEATTWTAVKSLWR